MKAIAAGACLAPALLCAAARAGDLPLGVEPVRYVRFCDAYGAGFFELPGTDTCLRLSGRVRADSNFYLTPNDDILDAVGLDPAERQSYRFRARGTVHLDSRTATEWGLLRTVLELEATTDSLDQGALPPAVTRIPAKVSLENAYMEYAGFTFGRTQSFYDFTDIAYSAAQQFDPAYSDRIQNVFAYTWAAGPLAATVALEDATRRWYGIAGGSYGGAQIPDVVGRLRYDDPAFGTAQAMAAGHAVSGVGFRPPGVPGTEPPEDERYGFALGAGVSLAVPVGEETRVGVTGSYAQGALAYLSVDIGSQLGVYDAALGSDLALSEGFSLSGGFSTRVRPTLRLGVNLGYVHVDVPEAQTDYDADGALDDFALQNFDAQAYLSYEPVDDLQLGLGAEYRLTDTADFADGSIFTTFLRAQRRF